MTAARPKKAAFRRPWRNAPICSHTLLTTGVTIYSAGPDKDGTVWRSDDGENWYRQSNVDLAAVIAEIKQLRALFNRSMYARVDGVPDRTNHSNPSQY